MAVVAGLLAWGFGAGAQARKSGLAFWEPPPAVKDLLVHPPKSDAARLAALRQAFDQFHCSGDQIEEQPAGPRGDENLICKLPGDTAEPILVVSRYDGHADVGWQVSWVDAFLLPVLYHALQAQPRHHTFVFAALHGDEGEAAFFGSTHSTGQATPSAMIVLDGLGYGSPLWYTVAPAKPSGDPNNPMGTNGILGGVAAAICRVLKIPAPANLNPEHYTTNDGFFNAQNWRGKRQQSTLFRGAGETPELLIYSDRPDDADRVDDLALPDIQKDLDFAAWLLCFADVKLDAAPAPASAPAAPATSAASGDSSPH
ncbi:MAG TPA: hypothetical protein VHX60_18285 [Acidobacteriaceae bacterium]|nr:hypothetical protein [Acidobacteriaceae bacterium]